MKTDLERFKEFYQLVGIELKEDIKKDLILIYLSNSDSIGEENVTVNDKFGGYIGMYSLVMFNKQGDFIKQNFYE